MKKIQTGSPSSDRRGSRKFLQPKFLWVLLCCALIVGGLAGLYFRVGLFFEGIGPLGITIKKVDFPSNGLVLSGRLYQPELLQKGAKIPGIVLLHGTSPAGAELFLYRLLAKRLAKAGNLVFLYDQRGYGASPDPPYSAESGYVLDFVGDAVNAIHFLAAQPHVDPDQLILVGHSFGGAVAIGVCNTPGVERLLEKAVIISPGRGYPFKGDQKDLFRQERLARDMRLTPPPSVTKIRNLFSVLEAETLVGRKHTLSIQLVNGEDEEAVKPLGPVYEKMTEPRILTIIPAADHYFSTNNIFNRLGLPVKFYRRAMIRELTNAIVQRPEAAEGPRNLVGIYKGGLQPGHYLQWQGKPIFLVGDSVTQGWMETGKDFNFKGYLDALADRGLNFLMLWSFMGTSAERQKKDERIGYDAPEIWPWMGSTDTKDISLDKFNPAYFRLLANLVGYAEKRGIIVLITVHDGGVKWRFDSHPFNRSLGNGPLRSGKQYVELAEYDREMPAVLNPSWNWRQKNQFFQERFCERLITELAPFSNVIYEMFNEGEWYNRKQRRLHEQHFLNFFRKRCKNILFTNTDHITRDSPHQDGKVDGISLHGGWLNRFIDFEKAFRRNPPKPYLLSEPVPGWAGDPKFLDIIFRSVIETTLAGAGWVNQNDTSFSWAAPAEISKKSGIRDRAYDLAGHLGRLLNSGLIPFFDMAPAGYLSDTGVCLALPGEEYLVYVPDSNPFTVDLSKVQGSLAVEWYFPATGLYRQGPPAQGGKKHIFQSPDSSRAILHLFKNPTHGSIDKK